MIDNLEIVKPLLEWAGGKSWIAEDLFNKLNTEFNSYHEPFLGGGSFFLKLKSAGKISEVAYLNDSNSDLINTYRQIKNRPKQVCFCLEKYKNNERSYYKVRDQVMESKTEKAAQFIYLNRTCYNGIYRVNLKGEFNVPFGHKQYKTLFDFNKIYRLHKLLQNVSLTNTDFYHTLSYVKENDLVFLDPPYTVNHEHNGFVKYNEKIFSWEDQLRLKIYVEEIIRKKAFFILTNACHKSIYDLFSKVAKPIIKQRQSVVGGKKATRGLVHEYIFSNCLRTNG